MNEWQDAIIDALVIRHIYQAKHDTDPRAALNAILDWEVMVALDPLVSSDAQALYQLGIQKGLEMTRWT
jgi:hypothetical protein